jgi:hypothetical protein
MSAVFARMLAAYDVNGLTITLPSQAPMEQKTARLTLLIDPNKKAAFERLCAQQDLTPSQVVRKLIRDYLAHHGVTYQPSGTPAPNPEASPPPAAKAATTSASSRVVRTARRGRPRKG